MASSAWFHPTTTDPPVRTGPLAGAGRPPASSVAAAPPATRSVLRLTPDMSYLPEDVVFRPGTDTGAVTRGLWLCRAARRPERLSHMPVERAGPMDLTVLVSD